MLHRIEPPACRPALEWIVKLQTDLVTALCDDQITPDQVTVAWAQALLSNTDSGWINRYCGWYRKKEQVQHSMLTRMQALARLPTQDRQQCLAHFTCNLQFQAAFDPSAQPAAIKPCKSGLSQRAAVAYRDFLEAFYWLVLENGVPVGGDGSPGPDFKRSDVTKSAQDANPKLRVCPLCDGGKDGSELDHWLPKEAFPELSCHPYNLVEICAACNGRENKGTKSVLDADAVEPFSEWFHPYLRSAQGTFFITINKGMVALEALDSANCLRIENLDRLVNLSSRWTNEYRTQFKRVQAKIRGRIDRRQQISTETLEELLLEWREDARAEVGLKANALIEDRLLSIASDTASHVFEELCIYTEEERCALRAPPPIRRG